MDTLVDICDIRHYIKRQMTKMWWNISQGPLYREKIEQVRLKNKNPSVTYMNLVNVGLDQRDYKQSICL